VYGHLFVSTICFEIFLLQIAYAGIVGNLLVTLSGIPCVALLLSILLTFLLRKSQVGRWLVG